MSPQNQASFLPAVGKPVSVGPSEYPQATAGKVIIKNHAVAINPIDYKLQDLGLWLQSFPAILGTDVAGEVVEVGDDVTRVKVGDRVAAAAGQAFQLYSAANQDNVGILPDSISYEDGAVFPVAINTASVGLYSEHGKGLGLPYPILNAESTGKIIVVWGGSASVGVTATQLAVASSVQVLTVASSRNHALCKSAGATDVFDYKTGSIVDDIVKAVKSSRLEFAGIFNAVSTPDTLKLTERIIEALGGGIEIVLLPDQSGSKNEKVNRVWIQGQGPVPKIIWENFFTGALQQGKLKPLPAPKVVGRGLESIQSALDVSRKGVSAQKLIVDLTA